MSWNDNLTDPDQAYLEKTADALMASDSTVTSLDFKKKVRSDDHEYRQDDASNFLMDYSVRAGWTFQDLTAADGEIYRQYSVPDPDDDDDGTPVISNLADPSQALANLAGQLDAQDAADGDDDDGDTIVPQ